MPDETIGDDLPQTPDAERLGELMKKYGASTLDELEEKMDKFNVRHRTFAQTRARLEELEDEVETLRRSKEEAELGVSDKTDPALKQLLRSVRNLERRVLVTPEDEELEDYLAEATHRYPHLMKIPDTAERLESLRAIARGLRAEKEMSANTERARQSGERKALSSSRAHVERSGGGFSTQQQSEDDDLKRFESEYEKADTQAKKDAVLIKYRRLYPDWGL